MRAEQSARNPPGTLGLILSPFPTPILFFKALGEKELLGEFRFSFLSVAPRDSKLPFQLTLEL